VSGLQSVRLQRFKRIADAAFDLRAVNVLVGGNNAGKSSMIQGLHFGIGLLQSIALADKSLNASTADSLSTSLNPNQLIYSPSEEVYALGPGGRLTEALDQAVSLDLTLDTGEQCAVSIRKGRNRNILVSVRNPRVADRLASLDSPFSIFSPGLAGIAKRENFVSDGVLYRALARGDANLVLRNILLRLWDKPHWAAFMSDLHDVFPTVELTVRFEEKTDEFIEILIKVGSVTVPLEIAGTGILQTIQILSYIHRFGPSIIVLDEPDSHLHPNNQRLLCALLRRVSEERGTQILLTTHSRHVIDALAASSAFFWVRNGTIDLSGPDDEIGILLDLGALDVKERAAQPNTDVIVLTEDEITQPLQLVLTACGFDLARTAVLSYFGVTGLKQLRPLVRLIRATNSKAKILLHRDRDFMTDGEVEQWSTEVRSLHVEPFVTAGRDIESYFLSPDHLCSLNVSVKRSEFEGLISSVLAKQTDNLVEDYVNGRVDIERKNGKASSINHGALSVEAGKAVNANPLRFAGKKILRAVRADYQVKYRASLATSSQSEFIRDPTLSAIAKKSAKPKTT
jgi:energy-coupling factor transporter ATP-binding protein EcfA2